MINNPMIIGTLELKNRLVMPPMHTGKGDRGHVTDDLIQYYTDRARFSRPASSTAAPVWPKMIPTARISASGSQPK